jgi:hypothetical protein
MNRFPVNPYLRLPQQNNLRYQLGMKPMMTSQALDPRFNDDSMSVASDATCMPGVSQENFSVFKSELCEMFKLLIDNTQKNLSSLIDSVKSTNDAGLSVIKTQSKENNQLQQEYIKNIQFNELFEVKNQLLILKQENNEQDNMIKLEISKIIQTIGKIKIKRKRFKRSRPCDMVLYKPMTKRESVPCDCFLVHTKGILTRGQILRGISTGDLKCTCTKFL